MSHAKEIRNANLREVLILQRHHYQHIETERYWFMSVYAAIIGVMLGFIFRTDITIDQKDKIWLLLFLIVLTTIGFFINIRWTQTLGLLGEKIKEIAGMLNVKEEISFEASHIGVWNILRTRYLFPFFYVIVFIGLVILVVTRLVPS